MIGTDEKRHRTIEVADPDLGGTGVEIKSAFFVDLGRCVGWGKDFDADLGRASQDNRILVNFLPAWSEPSDVDGLDAISGGYRTLSKNESLRKQLGQNTPNSKLKARVTESWGRTHEDASETIGLDAIWESGELRIGEEFGPTAQIKPGLRLKIGKLDRDRHARKIRQKWEKA
jgi:hypothetical protein